jgi:hypothetical protein
MSLIRVADDDDDDHHHHLNIISYVSDSLVGKRETLTL